MIARKELDSKPRIRNARSARTATHTRIVRGERARYSGIIRVSAVLGTVLVMLLSYVMLTSRVTGLTYALSSAQQQRIALQEQTARLDDRLARFTSEDRLATIAARLHMQPAQQFALVKLGAPIARTASRFPMISSLAGWFGRNLRE